MQGRYRQILEVHSSCLPWKALEWALLLFLVEGPDIGKLNLWKCAQIQYKGRLHIMHRQLISPTRKACLAMNQHDMTQQNVRLSLGRLRSHTSITPSVTDCAHVSLLF